VLWAGSLGLAFWAGTHLPGGDAAGTPPPEAGPSQETTVPQTKTETVVVTRSVSENARQPLPQNPETQADVLSRLPDGDFLAQHTANWAKEDIQGAAQWLNGQPQDPRLDGAVASFALEASKHDPAAAMDWARSIVDEQKRVNTMGTVGRELRAQNPQAFQESVADLPADQRERVEKIAEPRQRYQSRGLFYADSDTGQTLTVAPERDN